VWKWFNQGCVDGKVWIEEVRQLYAPCLGGQFEQGRIGIKAPWMSCFRDAKCWFIASIDKAVCDNPGAVFVGQLNGFSAEPPDADDGNE
jgi:hypothetical protein